MAQDLLEFLASLPNIANFELKFGNTDDIELQRVITLTKPMQLPSTMCPTIRIFRLQLLEFRTSRSHRNLQFLKFIAGFLHALRMPHVEDISIFVDFQDTGGSESESVELLSDISIALLPIHLSDPPVRLSSLNYKINYNPRITALKSPQSPLDGVPQSLHRDHSAR